MTTSQKILIASACVACASTSLSAAIQVPVNGLVDISDTASVATVLAPPSIAGGFFYDPAGSAVAHYGLSSMSPLFNGVGVDGMAAAFWTFSVGALTPEQSAMMSDPGAQWDWNWSDLRVLNGMGTNPNDYQSFQFQTTQESSFSDMDGNWLQTSSPSGADVWSFTSIDWSAGTGVFALVSDDVSALGLSPSAGVSGWISIDSGQGSVLESRTIPLPAPVGLAMAGLFGVAIVRRRVTV